MKTFDSAEYMIQEREKAKNLEHVTTSSHEGFTHVEWLNLNIGYGASDKLELIAGGIKVEENNSSKWEFNALHECFIEFDDINKELDGENPIALITHGDTERYVVVGDWIFEKIAVLGMTLPDFLMVEKYVEGEGFVVYKIDGNFKEWIKWAKKIKSMSWPQTRRKHNTVTVSLPKI